MKGRELQSISLWMHTGVGLQDLQQCVRPTVRASSLGPFAPPVDKFAEFGRQLPCLFLGQLQRKVGDSDVDVTRTPRPRHGSRRINGLMGAPTDILPQEGAHRLAAGGCLDLLQIDIHAAVERGLPHPVTPVSRRFGCLDNQTVFRQRSQVETRLIGWDAQCDGQISRSHRADCGEFRENAIAYGMGERTQDLRIRHIGRGRRLCHSRSLPKLLHDYLRTLSGGIQRPPYGDSHPWQSDPMMVIRARTEGALDAAPLFAAYREFYGEAYDVETAVAFLTDRLTREESIVLLARNDESVTVGFTQIYPAFSSTQLTPIWILNDLFVAPEARGTGVVDALLDTAATLAKDVGVSAIELATAHTNTRAQAVYDRSGYVVDEVFRHYERPID